MKLAGDIDIDLGNREEILEIIKHVPAAIRKSNLTKKHGSGVYVTEIPYDPINNMSTLDYEDAENRGYFKLDLLNVQLYNHVKNEQHLVELMKEPDWSVLNNRTIVETLIHLSGHYDLIQRMPEPINSIPRLAMFLALIRPSKRHLIGLPWKEVAKTVWDRDVDGYVFRKSHSLAYAMLVVVHMNMLREGIDINYGGFFEESNAISYNN